MDKYFFCLANSYKHDNRCLAGVEVERDDSGGYFITLNDWNMPNWIRPVSKNTTGGAIPNCIAENIQLFDVVLLSDVEPCPDGAQSENFFYEKMSVVYQPKPKEKWLDIISRTNRKVILGNVYPYISHDHFVNMDYSVLMIRVSGISYYLKQREDKQPQPRMKFIYNDAEYDFPITDPKFRTIVETNGSGESSAVHYLTISLSTELEHRHFKLVANVVSLENL